MATQPYNEVIDWYHTEGDQRTAIAATLLDADGEVVDLTGCTVTFTLTLASDNTVKINDEAATVDDEDAGQVSYSPSATFAALPAQAYWGWWVVTRTSDSKVDHYPPDGKRFRVTIVDAY